MELPMIMSAVAAGAIVLTFVGIYKLMGAPVDLTSRLGAYAATVTVSHSQEASPARAKRSPNSQRGKNFSANVARELAQANLKLTVTEYMLVHVASSVTCFLIGLLAARHAGVGLALAIGGFYLPRMYVKMRQKGRRSAFDAQLGDTLMLVSNSLRAGYSLLQSLEVVAREAPQPSAEEFSRVVREVSLGLTPEEALANLVRRIRSEDLDLMVTAINVQHEVGGNLAKILDTISNTIRERVRIKGDIRSLVSQQRLSGYIIALLPVFLAIVLTLLNPDYMLQLFSMRTVVCMPMIGLPVIAGLMILAGFVVISKLVAIEV